MQNSKPKSRHSIKQVIKDSEEFREEISKQSEASAIRARCMRGRLRENQTRRDLESHRAQCQRSGSVQISDTQTEREREVERQTEKHANRCRQTDRHRQTDRKVPQAERERVSTCCQDEGQRSSHTDLEVPVHYFMLVNVSDTLEYLMDAVTGETQPRNTKKREKEDERERERQKRKIQR